MEYNRGLAARTHSDVWTHLDDVPSGRRIVTIGSFDGVHRGHQSLLRQVVARARALRLPAMAVTFEPLPAQVLRPGAFLGRICSESEKRLRLASTGVDATLVLAFDQFMADQSSDDFLAVLADATGMTELWVGEAFALGKDRSGDIARITEIGRSLGFVVRVIPRLTDGPDIVSSSAIRTAVVDGNAARADRLLGRPFRVAGPVVHGAHLGRTIGYPTANIQPPGDLVSLADGIYATEAILPDGVGPRPAMTYVGTRPTVNSGERLVEAHLLDFDGDLYGDVIQVDILHHLRSDAAFPGLDALVAQLNIDEAATRTFFTDRYSEPRVSSERLRHPVASGQLSSLHIDPRD